MEKVINELFNSRTALYGHGLAVEKMKKDGKAPHGFRTMSGCIYPSKIRFGIFYCRRPVTVG